MPISIASNRSSLMLAAAAVVIAACSPADTDSAETDTPAAAAVTAEAAPEPVAEPVAEPASEPAAEPAAVETANAGDVHPGRAVYEAVCANCHDFPEQTRSPSLEALQQISSTNLTYALQTGRMKDIGATMSDDDIALVIAYLSAGAEPNTAWIEEHACPAERATVDLSAPASVSTFGVNLENHRHISAEDAGLSTDDLAGLELEWAIGIPNNPAMRSQPVVVGDTLFLMGADARQVFAFNIDGTPCVQWSYEYPLALRTSLTYGEVDGRNVLVFGDGSAQVHMLDAATGEQLWVSSVRLHDYSITTGTPVLHDGVVYTPVSMFEIAVGAQPEHECCKSHGAVTALDAATGEVIWTAHTMEEATPQGENDNGVMMYGPSGAPIWSTPAIDVERGLLYVGTGESTSAPDSGTTDSIMAFDLETGENAWTFQATAQDIYLMGCRAGAGGNCPPEYSVNRDVDFGASVIIAQRSDGSDVLLAGQKSGTVWALDPDNDGEVVWRRDFGTGGPLGGIHWGIAYDGTRVFAPINSAGRRQDGEPDYRGIHAVNVDTGEVEWSYTVTPTCDDERRERVPSCQRSYSMSGAPMVIDGAVAQGATDGMFRVFNTETGEMLFEYDTARPFETVNGVEGHGGGIDNASIIAANGRVFVSSGYSFFGEPAGNVLLSFRPAE
ncbi:MAG: PQQ-binding-like beta-propeller repeat protein [Maricaulaceae bacterium]|jgi:polyvinyl alcohol dehydrogenase (cytochrome)